MCQLILSQILQVDMALDAKHVVRAEFLRRLTRATSLEECRAVLQEYGAPSLPVESEANKDSVVSSSSAEDDAEHSYIGKLHADPLLGGVGENVPWLHLYMNRSAGDLSIRTEGIVPMYMLAYYPTLRDLLLEQKLDARVVDARITAMALLEVPSVMCAA